jgi:hypothetical protein
MRNWTVSVALTVVVLASAGCGGASKTTTTAATGSTLPAGVKTSLTNTPPPPKSTVYNVTLAGFSKGAPTGSGLAVISIKVPGDELCWNFFQLKNVAKPTVVRIYRTFPGASGEGGIPLGHSYTPSGCAHESSLALGVIERRPQAMYVNIHSAQFPNGAVEGPLAPGGEEGGAAKP